MTNIEYIKDKINAKQNILTVRKTAQKELGNINTLEIAIAEDETEIKYLESILCDLELLENIKSKTLLRYSNRKKIAKEYEKWCKDNNVMISDATNMITWLLCFKLKEWLENEIY